MLLFDDIEYRETLLPSELRIPKRLKLFLAIGECGEFLSEIGRTAQGRSSQEKLVDEIADVIIMMNQLGYYHNPELLRKRIEFKMNRVKDKLDGTR